jgi:hypothetical protein
LTADDAVAVEKEFADRMQALEPEAHSQNLTPLLQDRPVPETAAEREPASPSEKPLPPSDIRSLRRESRKGTKRHEARDSSESNGVDKSALSLMEPRRYRDKGHLRFVASKPCTVCGRQPSDPHHLRFTQNRALGRRVSDEFTVPLCRIHHREVHRLGDEPAWWRGLKIDPLPIALKLWQCTRVGPDTEPATPI